MIAVHKVTNFPLTWAQWENLQFERTEAGPSSFDNKTSGNWVPNTSTIWVKKIIIILSINTWQTILDKIANIYVKNMKMWIDIAFIMYGNKECSHYKVRNKN